MPKTPLNSFADVQILITQVLTRNGELGGVHSAPHKAFWNELDYDKFIGGNVPGVSDPETGLGIPILIKGNSAQSNLILSLRGQGPLFGPDGAIGQMPANGPPFFSPDEIDSIADWIDGGCAK